MAHRIPDSQIVIIHQAPTGYYYMTGKVLGYLCEDGFCRKSVSAMLETARAWASRFGWTHYQRGDRIRKL